MHNAICDSVSQGRRTRGLRFVGWPEPLSALSPLEINICLSTIRFINQTNIIFQCVDKICFCEFYFFAKIFYTCFYAFIYQELPMNEPPGHISSLFKNISATFFLILSGDNNFDNFIFRKNQIRRNFTTA